MENEKILSNEELMDITAGFTIKDFINNPFIATAKYGIKPPIIKKPYPPIAALYAVFPTMEVK